MTYIYLKACFHTYVLLKSQFHNCEMKFSTAPKFNIFEKFVNYMYVPGIMGSLTIKDALTLHEELMQNLSIFHKTSCRILHKHGSHRILLLTEAFTNLKENSML